MNVRILYANAYRVCRNVETSKLTEALEMNVALGVIADPKPYQRIIDAAETSYLNRNTVDPLEYWMSNARIELFRKRVYSPVGEAFRDIGDALMFALVSKSTNKGDKT